METEGLWSFSTRPVHGGFSDGDLIYSGSSITAITNWQDMQINDPARDLAWVFAKLDETHRNAVITAYGRVLGNRLDDLIMLRANLWVQMEQVGDFIKALNAGDNDRIMEFKAQVDRLAHKLGVSARAAHTARPASDAAATSGNAPSTVTVNTLLREDSRTAARRVLPASRMTPRTRPMSPVRAPIRRSWMTARTRIRWLPWTIRRTIRLCFPAKP